MDSELPERRLARPLLLFLVSALSFGGMAFAAKLASARLSGAQVAFLRFAFMLLPFALVPRLVQRALTHERLDLLAYRGLFGGSAVLLYFLAIAHLPVGVATLLNYSSPLFSVLFAALFLDERITVARAVPLFVALFGVALVGGAHASGGPWGGFGRWELVGLASAVLSGAAVTAIRAARRTEGSWAIYGSFTLCGLAATAPFGLWNWRTPDLAESLLIVAVGALSIVAQLAMTHAYRWIDNLRAGVFSPLSVVVAMGLGAFYLGERLTPTALAGSALAIAGVAATVAAGPAGRAWRGRRRASDLAAGEAERLG